MAEPMQRATSGIGKPKPRIPAGYGALVSEHTRKGREVDETTTNGPFLRGLGAGRRAQSTPREGPVDECSFRVYP
jgi:hypothetical protein